MVMFKCRCKYVQKTHRYFIFFCLSNWKTFKGCLKDGYQLWCNKAPFVVFSEMRSQCQRCTSVGFCQTASV